MVSLSKFLVVQCITQIFPSIDATSESGRYGRQLNPSRRHPNCVPKVAMLGETPRLIFVAKKDIEAGVELLYDYGDRLVHKKFDQTFSYI